MSRRSATIPSGTTETMRSSRPTGPASRRFPRCSPRTSSRIQERRATREKADAFYRQLVENAKKGDANNRLYQIESTMDYDPSADLEKIKARLLAINFADDAVNPPELGVLEAGVARIPGARSVVVPASPRSQGHQNAMQRGDLEEPLAEFLGQK